MRFRAEILSGLVWIPFGGFLVWAGHDLGIGAVNDPGAGFLIFWSGLLVIAFGVAVLLEAVWNPGPSLASLWTDARWGRVLVVIGLLTAYGAALTELGFLLATLPLMLALLRVVDPVPWRLAVPVALGSTLGVWWLMERLLAIRLPKGTLVEF